MMRNKEESRDRQEGNGDRRFGTVPHIVLIDRRALQGMITRLKFHRESILAVAKTSRVRSGRTGDARILEESAGVHYFRYYTREV